MQLDPNPTFRKAITSWYDSNFSCWAVIGVMLFVFLFALGGFLVALANPKFLPHLWFPLFLAGLSLFLLVKILLRLRKRSKSD